MAERPVGARSNRSEREGRPQAGLRSPIKPRPPACDLSATTPRRPTNCPSPSVAASLCSITTVMAGSTSTASRRALSPNPPNGIASPNSGDRLFRNRGDGHFEDVTAASGIGRFPRGHGHGVAVGDIDGDGHPDLFVTRWRSYALYRNKGDGTFEDITTRSGLGATEIGPRRRRWPTSTATATSTFTFATTRPGTSIIPGCAAIRPTMPTSSAVRSMPRPCPITYSEMTEAGSWM